MKETDEFHYCKKCFFFVCRECMDKNQLQFGMKQEELKESSSLKRKLMRSSGAWEDGPNQ